MHIKVKFTGFKKWKKCNEIKISAYGKWTNWKAKKWDIFYISKNDLEKYKDSLEIIDDNVSSAKKANLIAIIALMFSIFFSIFTIITKNNTDRVQETVKILQTDLSSIVLTWDIQPNDNVMPDYIWQIYIQKMEDKEYWPVSYIALGLSKNNRRIINLIDPYNGWNSLIPQISGYYK